MKPLVQCRLLSMKVELRQDSHQMRCYFQIEFQNINNGLFVVHDQDLFTAHQLGVCNVKVELLILFGGNRAKLGFKHAGHIELGVLAGDEVIGILMQAGHLVGQRDALGLSSDEVVIFGGLVQQSLGAGSGELAVFGAAFVGALIGFLWYNSFPAQVFMGDTGSLTIGGIIAVIAILIHKEILLVLLCGVFVAENLSVMAQVAYFKQGKKKGIKQRLFRRAPLHHHYNMEEEKLDKECTYLFKGPQRPLHEAKITLRFWIVTIVMAAITLMTLKIR